MSVCHKIVNSQPHKKSNEQNLKNRCIAYVRNICSKFEMKRMKALGEDYEGGFRGAKRPTLRKYVDLNFQQIKGI